MATLAYYVKMLIPAPLMRVLRPPYHYLLSFLGSVIYRSPSKEITVIGVTGTKGKSTVTEVVSAIFEADDRKVAMAGTIRFKIGEESRPNKYKMTMPGRFFMQKFLRQAVDAGCEVAVIEMTSEGVKQFRHKWIHLDALIFTNLTPEHIESHGSFENYVAAKLELAHQLERSKKRPRRIIANADDEYGERFLAADVEEKLSYSRKDPELYTLTADGINLIIEGHTIRTPLIGLFNVYNVLAAITCTRAFGVSLETIEKALKALPQVHGRVEQLKSPRGAHKQITAVVDYAHTPDSLEKLYQAFPNVHKVCVLGNTGGGRDTWKRPEMGRIAEQYCEQIILTNEDPYDEDPHAIVNAMANAITNKEKVSIVMDRREAIREALRRAPNQSVVLISGKGTDPYIMGPRGSKEPWSDAAVVQDELDRLFGKKEPPKDKDEGVPKVVQE